LGALPDEEGTSSNAINEPSSSQADSVSVKPLRGREPKPGNGTQAETPQSGWPPQPPAQKPRPQRAVTGSSFLNLEVPAEPRREEQTISGPSFLGLADETRYNIDYLLEDEPRESHWRLWLVLIILVLFGVMAWLQLRHSGVDVAGLMQRLRQAKLSTTEEQTHPSTVGSDSVPLDVNNSKQPAQNNPSTQSAAAPAASGAAATGDQGKSATDSPQPAASDTSKPSDDTSGDQPKASSQKSDLSGTDNKSGATADNTKGPSATAKSGTPSEKAAADTDQDSSTSNTAAKTPKAATSAKNVPPKKPSAALDDAVARSNRSSDGQSAALLLSGERYLYGRGVPRNCERAISDLRKASDMGNAKASSHLGAMYATGECLPLNHVGAYKYFAQALHQDSTNSYFQRNLEMLWNEMTPEEKQQATARTSAQ
jgi:TPR repeat protein